MSALVGPYEASLRERYIAAHSRLFARPQERRQPLPMARTLPRPAPIQEAVVSGDDWRERPTAKYDFGPYGASIYAEVKDPFRWRAILEEVANKHHFTVPEMLSARRWRPLVAARHEAMWRLKYETPMSMALIGRKLGGKDHTSVLWGVKQHQLKIDKGEAL